MFLREPQAMLPIGENVQLEGYPVATQRPGEQQAVLHWDSFIIGSVP